MELSAWNSPLLPPVSVQAEGEGSTQLPLNKGNLVYRVARRTLDLIGRKHTALQIRLFNRIPLARGLGSSSAAIVGGIVAANAGCGNALSADEMLRLAVEEEGHPDNVAPALLGGLCVAASGAGGKVLSVVWKNPRLFQGLRAVVCAPSFELSTQEARNVLPDMVPRADAVFNGSRVALFLSALQHRRFDLLGEAMEDRLHQPYRTKLVPGLEEVIQAARKAGAWGAALSGAGPSVLAFSPVAEARRVGEAMCDAFRQRGVPALWLNLEAAAKGAHVVKKTVRKGQ